MDKKFLVREDVYEFQHLPGSTAGTYWRDVRAVVSGDAEAQGGSPSPKGLPPIPAPEGRAMCHTPAHHGDSPIPSPGLPPLSESRHLPSSTTRPPDVAQDQLFLKKTDFKNTQIRLLDKFKQTHPIHRGLIEAVQEPSAWKLEKKKRIENAIQRVNNNYVTNPRKLEDADLNERVDSQYMPTPPKGPKPNARRNNMVILDPEKMLRDRNLMRGDFAPGRPTGHVAESNFRNAAPKMPPSASGHAPIVTFEPKESPYSVRAQNRYSEQSRLLDGNASENAMPSANRSAARMRNAAVCEQGQAWQQEQRHCMHMAHERIQQEYVDELRMEDEEEEPTSSQAEIDLDIKRQQLLAKKKKEKKKRMKHAELFEHEGRNDPFVPAPPSVSNATGDSYSKRKRHLKHEHVQSTSEATSITRQVNQGVEGFSGEPKPPLIPRSTKPNHGPVIRVEPQLTWNTSAAKRGLGFKSKLRREQEEAALQNKGHQNNNDAPSRHPVPTTSLPEETRKKWKNMTICNQR